MNTYAKNILQHMYTTRDKKRAEELMWWFKWQLDNEKYALEVIQMNEQVANQLLSYDFNSIDSISSEYDKFICITMKDGQHFCINTDCLGISNNISNSDEFNILKEATKQFINKNDIFSKLFPDGLRFMFDSEEEEEEWENWVLDRFLIKE